MRDRLVAYVATVSVLSLASAALVGFSLLIVTSFFVAFSVLAVLDAAVRAAASRLGVVTAFVSVGALSGFLMFTVYSVFSLSALSWSAPEAGSWLLVGPFATLLLALFWIVGSAITRVVGFFKASKQ